MRRASDSSQYRDETPRRRVRRTSSHDRRHSDVGDNVPTSPVSVPFMAPPSGNVPSSPVGRVSPHGSGNMVNYSHGLQRSQANMELSPRSVYPHSVISPSRYQSAPPVYAPHAYSTSSNISTPSCATPSSVTYTLSRPPVSPRTPDFFPGMQEPSLSPSRPMVDPGFPARSPSYFTTEHKPGFPEFSIPSPRDQFSFPGGGPSPGGTVHHHGYTNPRRNSVPSPGSTGYPGQLSPGGIVARSQGPAGPVGVSTGQQIRSLSVGSRSDQSGGNPSRKRLTLNIGTHDSAEIVRMRQIVIDYYMSEMETLKANFREKLQEVFFLQNGGNMMNFMAWKGRTHPQLLAFLNTNSLDDSVSMTTPTATNTVSPSTQLPPAYVQPQAQQITVTSGITNNMSHPTAQKQIYEQPSVDAGNSTIPQAHFNPNPTQSYQRQLSVPEGMPPNVSPFTSSQISPRNVSSTRTPYSRSLSVSNPPPEPTMPSYGHNVLSHAASPGQGSYAVHTGLAHAPHVSQCVMNGPSVVHPKPTPTLRTHSLTSVLDNSFGTHEEIAIEAKREAEVLKRVAELRKEGLWIERRLPKVQEMSRRKAHWDYLLEEMQWLAADFVQERRWKRGVAKKVNWAMELQLRLQLNPTISYIRISRNESLVLIRSGEDLHNISATFFPIAVFI